MQKTAIITGGGSGIGRATCEALARKNYSIIIVDINETNGTETEKIIQKFGGEALFQRADVSNSVDVKSIATTIRNKYSHLDILINNAATMTFASVLDLQESDWDKVLAVNLRGPFLMSKHLIPLMHSGSIINIGSVHGTRTTKNVSPYATSKAGLEAFTRALSIECCEYNIRVNCVIPGSVDTPMLRNNPNIKSGEEILRGPVASPSDIADAICFLSSDKAHFINGSCLVIDNGLLSRLN